MDSNHFYDEIRSSSPFWAEFLLESSELRLSVPLASQVSFPHDAQQDTLAPRPTYEEPLVGGSVYENALYTCAPAETMLPNVAPANESFVRMQASESYHPAASASDFQLVSGHQPSELPRAMMALPSIDQHLDPEQSGLKCNFPSCRSKATFKRSYDLERHMKGHTREETFNCFALNCKYRKEKNIVRPDKLKSHVKNSHDQKTLFACPVPECLSDRTPISGAILVLHIHNHRDWDGGPHRALFKALECGGLNTKCPIIGSREKFDDFDLTLLQGHLRQHSEAERTNFRNEIVIMGFDPINCHVVCPLPTCQIRLPNLNEFHKHLITHLVSKTKNRPLSHFDGQDIWEILLGHRKKIHTTCCQAYKMAASEMQNSPRDLEELRGCREQLLQLCRCVGITPIFDDVMPNVHQSSTRQI